LKIYQSPKNEGEKLHPDFDYTIGDVICAIQEEMALTVEDVLARRTRILFLNAKAAIEFAPKIAEIMAQELGKDELWQKEQVKNFNETAKNYLAN
jgi:glycerol-3-phosphate dehydrogenase